MIRVLICDDQAIARHGLQMILSSSPEIEIVGEAQDGQAAIDKVTETNPDIVLMDLKMPGVNGVQATRAIRRAFPSVQILVLTTYDDDEWVFDAIRAGANGYLLKDAPPQQLLGAIRNMAAGKSPVDPSVAGKILSNFAKQPSAPSHELVEKLSDREIEVLQLISEGFTNAEIGARLHLSEGTIRNYLSTIFGKLSAKDRTQAVVMAIRYGLINIGNVS